MASTGAEADKAKGLIPEWLVLCTNFGLWYAISACYNIYNKKALNNLHLPNLVATIQMATGIALFVPAWLLRLREAPFKSTKEFREILWNQKGVALFTSLSHIAGVIALGAGSVSFTQVVKGAEPVFTALISALFMGQFLAWQSYLSLVPVIAGVCLVSANEMTFSWFCLIMGGLANLFAGARSVFGKAQMSSASVKNMSSENYYSIITILATLMLVPATVYLEGAKIGQVFEVIRSGGALGAAYQEGLKQSFYSGLLFYMYNELSFKVLGRVNPVTHAIANTAKRVVIIISSVIWFHNPINMQGKVGSAVTLTGLLVYSLSEYYTKQKKWPGM
ncbi:triose-phosphate transporter family-domain-containing protein [Ochromonadaceae sp. CCMP2298]|nr:triose-phosphate transporter family-domain-containing protein [Ochromonadaceae sp. CCMP2298]